MAIGDGHGWVYCDCGQRHWGIHGAAGLLLVRTDTPEPLVLLQLRAGWTHGGGTWALPGGALDSHEDSVMAAAREAYEETGIDPRHLDVTEYELHPGLRGSWGDLVTHLKSTLG